MGGAAPLPTSAANTRLADGSGVGDGGSGSTARFQPAAARDPKSSSGADCHSCQVGAAANVPKVWQRDRMTVPAATARRACGRVVKVPPTQLSANAGSLSTDICCAICAQPCRQHSRIMQLTFICTMLIARSCPVHRASGTRLAVGRHVMTMQHWRPAITANTLTCTCRPALQVHAPRWQACHKLPGANTAPTRSFNPMHTHQTQACRHCPDPLTEYARTYPQQMHTVLGAGPAPTRSPTRRTHIKHSLACTALTRFPALEMHAPR